MCRNAMRRQKSHWVCLPCRFSAKHYNLVRCPQCRADMVDLGPDFRPPRKTDYNQWRKVEMLVGAGIRFGSCCEHNYSPRTLADMKAAVAQVSRPRKPHAQRGYDWFLDKLERQR